MALYDHIRDTYDLVYADTGEKVPFVAQKLREYRAQRVLELGSGTGLFAIPLKNEGFQIEGLELSSGMIAVAAANAPTLPLHQGDMRSYELDKQYDAILCLSSCLVLLKDHAEMRQCLNRTHIHLTPGGLFFLELPNHPVEIQQCDQTQEVHKSDDDRVAIVIQCQKAEPYWREHWHIFRATDNSFSHEEVDCDEFLYSPEQLEKDLQETGFDIVECYGDLFGQPFEPASSWRRVLLCKRR